MTCETEEGVMLPAYRQFNELRLAGHLCDVVLVADGVKFEAHRIILCGCSSYFQALFTCDWNNSRTLEYQLPGISPETMRQILEYIYMRSLLVTADNVESLLGAANQLNIMDIMQCCINFLHDQLCLESCIGFLRIASIYSLKKLRQSALRFILKNFKEVASTSKEFPDLTLCQLSEIIEKDELNVKKEKVVFDAILRWIMHEPASRKAHISVLLPKVRMARMNTVYFMKTIMNNDLVKANVACRPIVIEALKAMYNLYFKSSCSDFKNPLICPRLPSEFLLAIGGWTDRPTNWINAYDTRADHWLEVTQQGDRCWSCHGIAYLKGFVYCIGGYDGLNCLRIVHRFDLVTRKWKRMAPMYQERCYVNVVVLDGLIYAIGGVHHNILCSRLVERYDPETNSWSGVSWTYGDRVAAGAAALNGKIYVCGGYDGYDDPHEVLSCTECYDPVTTLLSIVAPMSTPRHSHGVAAYKGRIYAVGGRNGSEYLQSMEAYDPWTNSWHTVAPMFTPRSCFGIGVVEDLLFVLGGSNGFNTTNRVECYDAETGSWYCTQKMCTAIKNFSCCVVPALPGII